MKHEFKILKNRQIEIYDDYDKIPEDFDHIISFKPWIPDGPHTHDEHSEISEWNNKLQNLIKKEKENASRNKNR
jgi:hypothetical protein